MSSGLNYAIFAIAVIALAVFYLFFYRDWRRARRLRQPFPASWRALLHQQVPWYRALPPELKQTLEQRVQLFLAEKTFYGCDGFTVDDTVRLTVANRLARAGAFGRFDHATLFGDILFA